MDFLVNIYFGQAAIVWMWAADSGEHSLHYGFVNHAVLAILCWMDSQTKIPFVGYLGHAAISLSGSGTHGMAPEKQNKKKTSDHWSFRTLSQDKLFPGLLPSAQQLFSLCSAGWVMGLLRLQTIQ
jgi:hypothetical protein